MSHNSFQFGAAEVTNSKSGPLVTVRCPHCRGTHRRDRRAIGSREVLAGCSRGHRDTRTYAIPLQR